MSEKPPCFSNPKLGKPCEGCAARTPCYEAGALRPVFLLPLSRPVAREAAKAGATLAVEVDCETCGPTQKLWIDGQWVCSKCKQPLE